MRGCRRADARLAGGPAATEEPRLLPTAGPQTAAQFGGDGCTAGEAYQESWSAKG